MVLDAWTASWRQAPTPHFKATAPLTHAPPGPGPADVPLDLADGLDRLVPEGTQQHYRHDDEGPDDMPAHLKVRRLA